MKKTSLLRLSVVSLALFLVLAAAGCGGLGKDIKLGSLMQKKQHQEVIALLQGDLDQGLPLTTFQLYTLAMAYFETRDYDRMLATVDRMDRQIAQGDTEAYGSDLTPYPAILRAYSFLDQGEYEKALDQAARARTLLARSNPSSNFRRAQKIDIESVSGIALAQLGRNAEARDCVAAIEGVSTSMSILGPEKYAAIARVNMALKNYPAALEAVQNPAAKVSGAVTLFYDQTFEKLPVLFILTKCLYETGKTQEARDGYDALLKHPQIREAGGIYWESLLDRARIARAEGQDGLAETLLNEAMEVIEKQRSSIRSDAGRIGFVGDKQLVYQELAALLMDQKRPAEAFVVVERAKGRALVDLLASQKDMAPGGNDAPGAREMAVELARAEKEMDILPAPGSGAGPENTRGIVVALKKELAAKAPEFTSLVSVTASPATEIQGLLAKDETLVEYYAAGDRWLVFALTRDGLFAADLGPLDLDRQIREFRSAIGNPATRADIPYSLQLYKELILPVSGQIRTGKITFVPHGPLHYLPFAALSSGGRYLVDRAAIRVLPTASVLKFMKTGKKAADPATLVMGNPDLGDPRYDLRYAQDEARAIAGAAPRSTLLLRDKATLAFFKGNAASFDRIHLAAHGVFDPDDPLGSALLLAGNNGGAGMLRAGDLYNLTLNADLVTLSACETALGKVTKGDDVVGFTRGFLYAGAGSVVSTLWQVDDLATKDLMLDFYENMRTMEKDEALRQAQLKTRTRYPQPFYWAAFQLTGNAR